MAFLRRIAGHVRWQRDERDREEQRQGAALQFLAPLRERQQQQTEGDDRGDGRHVIEQQMHVHEVRSHESPYGLTNLRIYELSNFSCNLIEITDSQNLFSRRTR